MCFRGVIFIGIIFFLIANSLTAQIHLAPQSGSEGIPGSVVNSFVFKWAAEVGAVDYGYVLSNNRLCFETCPGDTRQQKTGGDTTAIEYDLIADRSFYHLGGHAYVGYFPANECLAYLYYIDTNSYTIPVDTVSVDSNGYFDFYQVPTGNYYIKVQPKKSSEYYGNMMPTYYGDVVFWEDATQIKHDHTNWGYNVHFMESVGIDLGAGNISGNVKYIEILEGNDYDLPAQGIDIYVFDALEQTLVSHYSDQDGAFQFPDVALGTYWLYPEVTGVNQKKIEVNVTVDEPDVSDIEIILIPGGVDTIDYIHDFISKNALGLPYPNPATDLVRLNLEVTGYGDATIDVFDLQGRMLNSNQMQMQNSINTVAVKVAGLKAGIYFIRANVNGIISEQRFVVSR